MTTEAQNALAVTTVKGEFEFAQHTILIPESVVRLWVIGLFTPLGSRLWSDLSRLTRVSLASLDRESLGRMSSGTEVSSAMGTVTSRLEYVR